MLKILLRVLVTVLLLGWLLFSTDFDQLKEVTRAAHGSWLFLGVTAYLISMGVTVLRWQILLQGLNMPQPFWRLARIFLIGCFFNMFLPSSIGGDVMKMVLLTPDIAKREVAISSVLMDRVVGLASIIGVGLCAALALPAVRSDMRIVSTLAFTCICFVLALAVLVYQPLFTRLIGWLPKRLHKRLAGPVTRVYDSLGPLRQNPQVLVRAMGASVVLQLGVCISMYFAGQAFGVEAGLLAYFALIPVGLAVTALPISINGLGVLDNMLVLLFSTIGVPQLKVFVLSIYLHLMQNGLGILGGILFAGQRNRQAGRQKATETQASYSIPAQQDP